MKILLIKPGGREPEETDIGEQLEDLQAVVGGYIEIATRFSDGTVLLCNEEGKLLGLPTNRYLTYSDGTLFDLLVGNLFICGAAGSDFVSLTDTQIAAARRRIQPLKIITEMEAGWLHES